QKARNTRGVAAVRYTHGKLEIPTYTFARSETVAPLFQSVENAGLYPYAALDRNSLSRQPVPAQYESLTLENEYLRVVFLPELGGRIWSARDKIANREIFYRTSVIKPSRYNQRGGWPVGNFELYGPYDAHMLTWPGEPWPWEVLRDADGSATVVLSHIDHFFRNKISLAVTLRPGRAYLETTIHLHNKNTLPNRYLLWTNAGVAATEGTRFVYPMTKTIGHDTSKLGTWPVTDGVDLSWHKNNKNMLGVFGLDLYDNFIAAYDYKIDYGTICYTDRLLARGAKTWTWGTGPAAMRHMASYTDRDGPYVEVQSGRFVWDGNYEFIDPGKTDGWTEYWYGAGNLGGLTTANRDVAMFLDVSRAPPAAVKLAVTATGVFPDTNLELFAGDARVWEDRHNLSAGSVYRASIPLKSYDTERVLVLRIRAHDGKILATDSLHPDGSHPNAVFAADSIPRSFAPLETLSVEERFQKGLSHEKFGQLNDAEEMYKAALAMDSGFAPAHLRLGLLALDRAQHQEAVRHFLQVLERDPTNGDAHYYLAVGYDELGNNEEAELHYFRLLPSSSKFDRRDYGLALLALRKGDLGEGEKRLSAAASKIPTDIAARQAYLYLLRKVGRTADAQKEMGALIQLDPTNAFARAEAVFLGDRSASSQEILDRFCARHGQGYLELATEYMRLSAWKEAARVLERSIQKAHSAGDVPYPLLHYYRAYVADREKDTATTRKSIEAVRSQDLRIDIFPFRRETIQVLNRILEIEPKDSNARSLLGDVLYSRNRRPEALAAWRSGVEADPKHFSSLRNLGMALLEEGKTDEGLRWLMQASEARPDHLPTTLLVASMNARRGNVQAAREALQRALQRKPGDDLLTEKLASLEAQTGNHQRALELLAAHTFEPRHQSYSLLHLYQGVRLMLALNSAGTLPEALKQVRMAAHPPSSLGVDDFAALQSPRLRVFEALLHATARDTEAELQAWKLAAQAADDEIEGEGLFRAIALYKQGETRKAEQWLGNFSNVNEQRKKDNAVELRVQAYYLDGIYAAFQRNSAQARENFLRALAMDQSYLFARQALAWLEAGKLTGLGR
ncbi:MAG TPA: DUF5107 domain-containing protein, partial [Acidobacteriota bacterium]|nr:DUF5107 domain-containing protein [Acidobacteriota bacterium]